MTDAALERAQGPRVVRQRGLPLACIVKRGSEIAVALLMLVLLAPVLLLVALAIKLDSPGPLLYRCRRVGVGGRVFEMLKFRKMHRAADGPALTFAEDERFTVVGRFLARTKLDELPQLFNVIRGEMSLVGPRPEDPAFVAVYPEPYLEILSIRPGITGLSQLAFAREWRLLGADDIENRYLGWLLPSKIQIDLLYVARRTLLMDLRILAWTVVAILCKQEVAVHRRTGNLTVRRRELASVNT